MKRGKPLTVAERHLVRTYGMDPRRVASPARAAPPLVAEATVQTARSYIYTEQAGRHGTRVYLAYASGSDVADYLRPAYRAGSPYPTRSTQ